MNQQVQTQWYQSAEINFLHAGTDVKVNATQMAKIFDKKIEAFTRNENTQKFIKECLKSENSRFLNLKNESDLIDSRQKSGTYMHRIMALKFAAWLDPSFELWVFTTIDAIMMGHYRQHREESLKAIQIQKALKEKENRLLMNPDFKEYQQLQSELKNTLRDRLSSIKQASKQIELEFNPDNNI